MMSNQHTDICIPVVILHRDEPQFLLQMVDAIKERTSVAYQLFVVDNNSALPESIAALDQLKASDIVIIHNRHNRWVLGFNNALRHERFNRDSPYYVFSDCDIVVPDRDDSGACWLSRLIGYMDNVACAGKIGISTDLTTIKGQDYFRHIYQEELTYSLGPRIGDLVIAPVDTRLAIYRKNMFVMEEFRFLPGHKSLMKPHLYSLRTQPEFSSIHLGWQTYGKPCDDNNEKIRCFSRYGGFVDRITLSTGSFADRMYYKFLGPLWRAAWGLAVIYFWCIYIAKRFPRDLNELQTQARMSNDNTG